MYYSKLLEDMYLWGVRIFICGKPATPESVAECICGGGNLFTASFMYGTDGNLSEIHYDLMGD